MTMAKKLPLLAPSIHTFEVNGTYTDCEAKRTVFMAIQKMVSAGKYYRIPYHGSSKKGYSYKRKDGGLTITLADYPDFKQLYDSSAAFQSLKPVYDGLQKIKFEKPRAKYKAEHETELKQFYAARRKLTGEFPDGKVDMKKLTEEYDELEQAHNTTYGEFKAVRDDLHRLWKVKSCVDTAARFNERTEEQMLQNRPQTRQKKEELSR